MTREGKNMDNQDELQELDLEAIMREFQDRKSVV